jgi:hypothetical protein
VLNEDGQRVQFTSPTPTPTPTQTPAREAEQDTVACLNDIYKYHAGDAAPAVRVARPVRLTRAAADMCFSCKEPCKTHDRARAYATCKQCKSVRVSVQCLQVPAAVKRQFDASKHEEVTAVDWRCDNC